MSDELVCDVPLEDWDFSGAGNVIIDVREGDALVLSVWGWSPLKGYQGRDAVRHAVLDDRSTWCGHRDVSLDVPVPLEPWMRACGNCDGALKNGKPFRLKGSTNRRYFYTQKQYEKACRMLGLSNQGVSMAKTSIYRHGGDVSVVTDATDEREFEEGFAQAFAEFVAKGNGNGHGANRAAVRAAFDINAKLRGYKSEVLERRMLASGRWPHPSEKPAAEFSPDDDVAEGGDQ